MAQPAPPTTKDRLRELDAKARSLDAALADAAALLCGAGMTSPLTDGEGFPRADIDVYTVRAARATIVALQNDRAALQREQEALVHELLGAR